MRANASRDIQDINAINVLPVIGNFPIVCRALAIPAGSCHPMIARVTVCARRMSPGISAIVANPDTSRSRRMISMAACPVIALA